jgi:hypothetical protein
MGGDTTIWWRAWAAEACEAVDYPNGGIREGAGGPFSGGGGRAGKGS